MVRLARFYLGHVYMPRRRTAYGWRPGSRGTVEELRASRWVRLHHASAGAGDAAPPPLAGVQRVAVPMPHGGVRWLLECPQCGRHTTRLYSSALALASNDDQAHHLALARCRACLGVQYWSQREGRRPEAALERVMALRAAALRTHDPALRQRRLERVRAVAALRARREKLHEHHRRIALRGVILPVLTRKLARARRVWLNALLVALRAPLDERAVMALRFAIEAERAATEERIGWRWPVWACEVLCATLDDAEGVDASRVVEGVDADAGGDITAELVAARTGVPVPPNVITLEEVEAYRVRMEARRRQAAQAHAQPAMLPHLAA